MSENVQQSGAGGSRLTLDEVRACWYSHNTARRQEMFNGLNMGDAHELFDELNSSERAAIILFVPPRDQRILLALLQPDEVADLVQEVSVEKRGDLLNFLDPERRGQVNCLLEYKADQAGGIMNPHYVSLRADMTAGEAFGYVRNHARKHVGTQNICYHYVVDDGKLVGVISVQKLLAASPSVLVKSFMDTDVVTVTDKIDQEEVSKVFAKTGLLAIPVVDSEHHIKGIITIDDVMDVVHKEATEDQQKQGGVEALGDRYLQVGMWEMLRKRGGWLAILFVGELATASAMSYFEGEIAKAVVLALFVPLIISSGGNSGSQASTLVVRALALGEVRLRDWLRVVRREAVVGFLLGVMLAGIGVMRILLWQSMFGTYGEHYVLIAVTVGISLVMIVMWGSMSGSILPFILKRCGFDPASASTPFVATLVDVTGLVIYFTVASIVLAGTML